MKVTTTHRNARQAASELAELRCILAPSKSAQVDTLFQPIGGRTADGYIKRRRKTGVDFHAFGKDFTCNKHGCIVYKSEATGRWYFPDSVSWPLNDRATRIFIATYFPEFSKDEHLAVDLSFWQQPAPAPVTNPRTPQAGGAETEAAPVCTKCGGDRDADNSDAMQPGDTLCASCDSEERDETPSAPVKVVFRKFRSGGEIIALFPEIPADSQFGHCMSYVQQGQHGAASVDLSHCTSPAKPEEYAALKHELETYLGPDSYVLEVRKVITPAMHATRRAAMKTPANA